MFVLFKKRIAVDTSNEEISRVTTILDQNNIKYELLTKRTRGVYGSAYDAQSYARANVAMYKGSDTANICLHGVRQTQRLCTGHEDIIYLLTMVN